MPMVDKALIVDAIRNRISEDVAAAHAEFVSYASGDSRELILRTKKYLIDYFDIHAYYHHFLIADYRAANEVFEPYLNRLLVAVVGDAERMTAAWHHPLDPEMFVKSVHVALIGRLSHWKSEGLKRARQMGSPQAKPTPTGDDKAPAALQAEQDVAAEGSITDTADRRAALLKAYKESTGNPSNRQIYSARNSGIHKPEFYEWLKGELSVESETAKNFERFLREEKAPIPRTPKP
jgi:hypothetical protein